LVRRRNEVAAAQHGELAALGKGRRALEGDRGARHGGATNELATGELSHGLTSPSSGRQAAVRSVCRERAHRSDVAEGGTRYGDRPPALPQAAQHSETLLLELFEGFHCGRSLRHTSR